MLKKMIFFVFIMSVTMCVLGCESEAEKQAKLEQQQQEAIQKQKKEARAKMIQGEIVKSPKREW